MSNDPPPLDDLAQLTDMALELSEDYINWLLDQGRDDEPE